ncbi:hypothetical protein F383_16714 [Gossypium arboreum]|uniref:Uncharacterized protein n=1 Tax=Gossypium arboreum TaxID=29729 RepID=A0A0B0NDM7_GOSAR|nr:hypothetical protein F383_16714 [Gossypium arboreum]
MRKWLIYVFSIVLISFVC